VSAPLLELAGLEVAYGRVPAVRGLSLTVGAGEIVGLIGPNGAGKTTLIDAVTGFVPPTSGTVHFAGVDVTSTSPAERARAGLVRTFQSLELFEDLTVGDNLRVAAEPARWWNPLADAVRPRRVDPSAVEAVAWALEVVGLAGAAGDFPSDLSHGQRKLVAVARALASQPRLVLLDEPAAGLDSTETALLGEHLRTLPEHGVTVLLVDHDMGLVLGLCDLIHVLDFGLLIASGTPAEIRGNARVALAYLGTASTERESHEPGMLPASATTDGSP
jgi:branched-chain amino acid transport system ATP-binding protein